MGSASSKFKKYLQHGDEFAAMQIFQSSPELRKNLDPNLSYGDHHGHNTALHYAAKHGMKHLLRTFLADLGGNPNKRNGRNESVLHCACQLNQQAQQKSFSAQERRAACVTLLLQWKGVVVLTTGQRERADLAAQDQEGNTPLHWAAGTGLRRCVELLLAHGAPLFIENNDRLTPCDLAMRANHHDIAQLLESRMVFADSTSDTVNEDELAGSGGALDNEEVYSGLRTQDLQEAKDQLLVETSDMLHIPLFTAEALLRDNEWSREALLEKWMKDPVQCCQLAGVQAPSSALQFTGGIDLSGCSSPEAQDTHTASNTNNTSCPASSETECEICLCVMPAWQQPPVSMSCKHQFCTSCWERYLTVKIQDGDAHHILCPAYQCHILVPVEVIEKLVSPEMARRYLQFDIKAFVESNRSIKWCPIAGCGRAVRLPETEQTPRTASSDINGAAILTSIPATSHAVDCGNAHFFCWECLGEAHAPSGCAQWLEWHRKIAEVKPEELKASCSESEDAANCLWLVTNSKPCPNCKSPIQKNEGCNHMKCSKCKFDFCWVCQESWKRHSSATGGYFRCNRFEAVHKADERQGSLITEATVRNSHVQELSRFLHYYTRFRNHENSQRLEQPLLTGVRQKMELLASVLPQRTGREDAAAMRFVEDGVRELLKARRVLCGSYVYGYYLEDNGYNKTIFEFMQNELEEVTEKLSEMIARPYLRTPRAVIVQTTALTRRKRHEFVRAVAKGLVPPETPPALRKVRTRGYSDMDMSEALAASLRQQLDGPASWSSGESKGDWPAEYEGNGDGTSGGAAEESEVNLAIAVSLLGECRATGCNRPRARNPAMGVTHQYCSLRCSRQQEIADCDMYRVMPNLGSDYNMELVIALEMSRLQMIEDKMKQGVTNVIESVNTPGTSIANDSASEDSSYGLDDQLKLAIQLSLQESTAAISRQLRESASGQSVDNQPQVVIPQSITPGRYQRTNADFTVDCFLKSLANHKIDLKSITGVAGDTGPGGGGKGNTPTAGVGDGGGFFKPCSGNEDGRFQISDIHENGFGFGDDDDDYDENDVRLKRSHSTGDLCVRRSGRGFRVRPGDNEPRYHLDSDHSSQHDERPEEISRRSSNRAYRPGFQVQSSAETTTTTTTSDSLNADMEVCGILQTAYDSDQQEPTKRPSPTPPPTTETMAVVSSSPPSKTPNEQHELTKKYSSNPFASLKAKLCSAHLPKTGYLTKIAVNKSIGLLSEPKKDKLFCNVSSDSRRNSDHAIQKKKSAASASGSGVEGSSSRSSYVFSKHVSRSKPLGSSASKRDSNFSKSTSFLLDSHRFKTSMGSNLRIKICKSPLMNAAAATTAAAATISKPLRQLETDSSNEYESETGIPKSPTLFISGVSISRTPEPKSPAAALVSANTANGNNSNGRQSRSSSLSVPVCSSNGTSSQTCSQSVPTSQPSETPASEPFTPSLVRSTTPASPKASPQKESTSSKAKSASEPEREREMFRFPKSSTDGALSSVLHVQESNLSSDDFHEALFLLERSPKTRDSKRRKKSKKKDKDHVADRMKEEASSAL